jgi:hypothetical protein
MPDGQQVVEQDVLQLHHRIVRNAERQVAAVCTPARQTGTGSNQSPGLGLRLLLHHVRRRGERIKVRDRIGTEV